MAGLTLMERAKKRRSAMTPAQRRKEDSVRQYQKDYSVAMSRAKRALKGMKPNQTKTLRGVSVAGRAVQVHRSNYQNLIRVSDVDGKKTRMLGEDRGQWVLQGNRDTREQKNFGGKLAVRKAKQRVKPSTGHSSG